MAIAIAWKPENPFTKVVQGDLQVVQRAVQGGAFRTNSQSPDWLGWWMAENLPHLGIKTRYHDKPRSKAGKVEVARLTQIIATWKKNEVLDIESREARAANSETTSSSDDNRPNRQRAKPMMIAPLR